MDRIKVQSSSIAEIGYDRDHAVLEVVFNAGSVYQYFNVPEEVYILFVTAESHGRYFSEHIREEYAHQRLTSGS